MKSSTLAVILYFLFTISGALLLLNLLIALMTQMFETVQSHIEDNFLKDRAVFVSKKLAVYIFSQWNFTLFTPLKPRLHPLQLALDEKRKLLESSRENDELSRWQRLKSVFVSPPKSAQEAKTSVKWSLFIRSTLFRPYITGKEPLYAEYEEILLKTEWRDWNGRVVHKKKVTFANVTEQQWTETQSKVTQLGIRVHDQIVEMEKQQEKIQVLLRDVADHSFMTGSLDTMTHEQPAVRQKAVGMLKQSIVDQVEDANAKIVDLVMCKTLSDTHNEVVLTALDVISEKKLKSPDIIQSMNKLLSSPDTAIIIKVAQTMAALVKDVDSEERTLLIENLGKSLQNQTEQSVQIECALAIATLTFEANIKEDVMTLIQRPLSLIIENVDQNQDRLEKALSAISVSHLGRMPIIKSIVKVIPQKLVKKEIMMVKKLVGVLQENLPIVNPDGMTLSEYLEQKKCTYLATGPRDREQKLSYCITCNLYWSVCETCAETCHKCDQQIDPSEKGFISTDGYCKCSLRRSELCKSIGDDHHPAVDKVHQRVIKVLTKILMFRKTLEDDIETYDMPEFFDLEVETIQLLAKLRMSAATAPVAHVLLECLARSDLEQPVLDAMPELLPGKPFADVIAQEYKTLLEHRDEQGNVKLEMLLPLMATLRVLPVQDLVADARNLLKTSTSTSANVINAAMAVLRTLEKEISQDKEIYTEILELTKTQNLARNVEAFIGNEPAKPGLMGEYFLPSLLQTKDNPELVLLAAKALIPTAVFMECRDQKICTRTFTGKTYPLQFYKRVDGQPKNKGYCVACVETCHKDTQSGDYQLDGFYCDCPDTSNCPRNKENDENVKEIRLRILKKALDPIFDILTDIFDAEMKNGHSSDLPVLLDKWTPVLNPINDQWKYRHQNFQEAFARAAERVPDNEEESRFKFNLVYSRFTQQLLPGLNVENVMEVLKDSNRATSLRETASSITTALLKGGNSVVANRLVNMFSNNRDGDVPDQRELLRALSDYASTEGTDKEGFQHQLSKLIINSNTVASLPWWRVSDLIDGLKSISTELAVKTVVKFMTIRGVLTQDSDIMGWVYQMSTIASDSKKSIDSWIYGDEEYTQEMRDIDSKFGERAETLARQALVELQQSVEEDWPTRQLFDQWHNNYLPRVMKEGTLEDKANAIFNKEFMPLLRKLRQRGDKQEEKQENPQKDISSSDDESDVEVQDGVRLVHFEDEPKISPTPSRSQSTSEAPLVPLDSPKPERDRSGSNPMESNQEEASTRSVLPTEVPLVTLDSPKPERFQNPSNAESDGTSSEVGEDSSQNLVVT
eukprot:TRINITY_DN7630_c0_g1_i1.p1 TRINITY_DN7630_c0_g1~~TRINITY_DN7630_c0_g1_i1.p1  ORF type:complete len:1353 (+),score=360.26 TRINITY_DN7630_c0_g1_i1:141-4061(+)